MWLYSQEPMKHRFHALRFVYIAVNLCKKPELSVEIRRKTNHHIGYPNEIKLHCNHKKWCSIENQSMAYVC